MKKMSIFIIPVIVVILVIGGAFAWKVFMSPADTTPAATRITELPPGSTSEPAVKPQNPFSALFGPKTTVIPTPTPASVAAMNADVAAIGDDGGAADFSSLDVYVNGL